MQHIINKYILNILLRGTAQWKINVNRKLVRVCDYIIYTFYICVLCNKLTSFHVNSLYFAFKIIYKVNFVLFFSTKNVLKRSILYYFLVQKNVLKRLKMY